MASQGNLDSQTTIQNVNVAEVDEKMEVDDEEDELKAFERQTTTDLQRVESNHLGQQEADADGLLDSTCMDKTIKAGAG